MDCVYERSIKRSAMYQAKNSILLAGTAGVWKISSVACGFSSIKSKYGCKDQESIQSSTTPDPGYQWESDKLTVRHHKREPRGQPFPSR